jgi:hypothetical protein
MCGAKAALKSLEEVEKMTGNLGWIFIHWFLPATIVSQDAKTTVLLYQLRF